MRALLARTGLGAGRAGEPVHRFLSSGNPGIFAELGRRLLGPELDRVEEVAWDARPLRARRRDDRVWA
ncbi:MAG: hypothetical protein ACRD0L_10745 [Acidimicrobiales bacterium]